LSDELSSLDLYPKDRIFDDLLAASDIGWVARDGSPRQGTAVRKICEHLLLRDHGHLLLQEHGSSGNMHIVHISKVISYSL